MSRAEALLFPDNLAALATARELGRAGIRVSVLGAKPGPGAYSRHSHFVRTPDLYTSPEAIVDAIVDFADERTKASGGETPVLMPTEDAALLVVERFHERLSGHVKLPFPAPGIVEKIVDKRSLHRAAEAAGIATPSLVELSENDPGGDCAAVAVEGDWLAKPPCRYCIEPDNSRVRTFLQATGGAKAVAGDLRAAVALVRRAGFSPILQEQVPGPFHELVSVGIAIDRNGDIKASFNARKRCEYPEPFGDGLIVEVIDDPGITEQAAHLLREIGYWGICDLEFKRDDRDGRFKLLDANPRVWLWHGLGAQVNSPIALCAYALATGEGDVEDSPYQVVGSARPNHRHPVWVSPRGAAAFMASAYNPVRHGPFLPILLTAGALGTMLKQLLAFQDPLYLRPSAWRDICFAVLRRAHLLPTRSPAESS